MRLNKLLYTLPEGRAQLGNMSNSQLYNLAEQGRIKIVKVGRRSYLTADEMTRFVGSLSGEGELAPPIKRDRDKT